MQRFVHAQRLYIWPLQYRPPLAGHFAGSHERFEADEPRPGRRLEALDQVAERKADPRHHHRPRFNAAQPVDAFLERVRAQNVLQRIVGLGHPDVALNPDGPRRRLQLARVARRVLLVGAEFVEVVVAGDVLERIPLLIRAEQAGRQRLQRRLSLCLPAQQPGCRGGRRGERRAGRRPHELTPIEIIALVRDFRSPNRRRLLDEHGSVPVGRRDAICRPPRRGSPRGCRSGRSCPRGRPTRRFDSPARPVASAESPSSRGA